MTTRKESLSIRCIFVRESRTALKDNLRDSLQRLLGPLGPRVEAFYKHSPETKASERDLRNLDDHKTAVLGFLIGKKKQRF